MNRIFPLILCLCMLVGMLSGCAAEDTPYIPNGDALAPEDADVFATEPPDNSIPQELTLAYYPERSMNPYEATDFTNRVLFSLIYQGLFSTNKNYDMVPILCKNYRVSSDYKIYTFLLEDATFSDGTPVTIEDVLASYEAAEGSPFYGERFIHVVKTAISDDGGLTFYLRTPVEGFHMLLDFPIVKASEVAEPSPLGTGPYIYENSLAGSHLRRNPFWWCESPDLVVTASSIPLVAAESATYIRDEFEFADVGLVLTNPCSDSYADYRCDYELWDCDSGVFLFLACNVAYSQDDVFLEKDVRSLLTYAIDRERLAATNYNGFARPASLPMDPDYPYYSAALASKYDYDPEYFTASLSRSMLPDEPLRLLVNSDDSMRLRTAREIVVMLTEVGLEVELIELSTKSFVQDIRNGKFDLYLGMTKLSPNMDLTPFFRTYGDMGWCGVANDELYTLTKEALENHGNYYNLHKAVMDDGRIVPILFGGYAVYATRGLVTDLQPARDNVFYYTLGRTDADAMIPIDYNNSRG